MTSKGRSATRFMRVAIVMLAVALLAAVGITAAPARAQAATLTFPNGGTATINGDGSITGTAHVVPEPWELARERGMSTGYDAVRGDASMPDGSVITVYCIDAFFASDQTRSFPCEWDYPFTARPLSGGGYDVTFDCQAAPAIAWADDGVEDWGSIQDLYGPYWNPPLLGGIDLWKHSTNESISSGNACYSLAGAVFGVYLNDQCTVLASTYDGAPARLSTDAEGHSRLDRLGLGTYFVKEEQAPHGFVKDETVHTVTVNAGEPVRWDAYDVPHGDPTGFVVNKVDADGNVGTPEGSASLAGAEFTVRYYDNTAGDTSGTPKRTWVFKTGENGRAEFSSVYKVSGDDFYYDDGTPVIPVGTVSVQETKAPTGYLLEGQQNPNDTSFSSPVHVQVVREPGSLEGTTTYNVPVSAEPVIRGGVKVGKVDRESRLHEPQGNATLAGAVMTIKNRSESAVIVNGKSYEPGQVVCELTTGADGCVQTASDALPYGSYEVNEKTPPRGYLANQTWSVRFDVREDGKVIDLSAPTSSVDDASDRGNLAGVKVAAGSMTRLPGVPFVVESKTTGEWHVLVTDENGEIDTDAWPHSQRTNANDAAITRTEGGGWAVAEGAALDPDAGTWFSGYADYSKNQTPVDARGALPFDTYRVTEVPCAANKGYEQVSFDVTVRRDGKVVNLGTVDDEPGPSIQTFAHEDGGEGQEVKATETVRLVDTVSYDHLKVNTGYVATGTLHVRNDDGSDAGPLTLEDGTPVTGRAEFTARQAEGSTDVSFEFPGSILDGRDLVAFESLASSDGTVVATHEDASDENQTVRVRPEVGTTATDASDGDHEVASSGPVTITDQVRYTGLRPGKAYKATGTLVLKDTGKPVLREDGTPVTAEAEFTPERPSGSVEVRFELDGALLAGKTAVAFESVSQDGVEVASHSDLEDRDQTVTSPSIATKASAALANEGERTLDVTDVVSYHNLVPGQEYELTATLHAAGAKEPVSDGSGVVTGHATLTPTEPDGEAEVRLSYDATLTAESDVTVFEELRHGGTVVATHAVEGDADQTFATPPVAEIHTEARDKADGDKNLAPDADQTVVDTVSYTGLVPGREYELEGTLHVKGDESAQVSAAADPAALVSMLDGDKTFHVDPACKELAEKRAATPDAPMLTLSRDAAEKALATACEQCGKAAAKGHATFTPTEADGTVDVEIPVSTVDLASSDLVAFETLTKQGTDGERVTVATHDDINDEAQTVHVDSPAPLPQTGARQAGAAALLGASLVAGLAACARLRLVLSARG